MALQKEIEYTKEDAVYALSSNLNKASINISLCSNAMLNMKRYDELSERSSEIQHIIYNLNSEILRLNSIILTING